VHAYETENAPSSLRSTRDIAAVLGSETALLAAVRGDPAGIEHAVSLTASPSAVNAFAARTVDIARVQRALTERGAPEISDRLRITAEGLSAMARAAPQVRLLRFLFMSVVTSKLRALSQLLRARAMLQ
jgi:hypothetical protein